MAVQKIQITLTDKAGEVSCHCEFFPKLTEEELAKPSMLLQLASQMILLAQELAEEL